MSPSVNTRPKLVDAPIAITSAGELVVNVTHLNGMSDVIAAIAKLVPKGQQLFVGIVVPRGIHGKLLKEVDDSLADVVGRVGMQITEASSSARRRRVRR